jgi:hypothetical protein
LTTKTIYGLKRLGSDQIKYIGQTVLPLKERLHCWKSNAARGGDRPVFVWIRSMPRDDLEIVGLEVTDDADQRERAWIATVPGLLNVAVGGPGCPGVIPDEETRAKRSESVRKSWERAAVRVRFHPNAEQRRKHKEACAKRPNNHMVGRKHSEETKAKMRATWAAKRAEGV